MVKQRIISGFAIAIAAWLCRLFSLQGGKICALILLTPIGVSIGKVRYAVPFPGQYMMHTHHPQTYQTYRQNQAVPLDRDIRHGGSKALDGPSTPRGT